MPENEVLDRARLDELTALDPTGTMLSTVIATFEETCDASLGDLEQRLQSGEVELARESAHTLAGRALMVGAKVAGETARELEHQLVNGDLSSAQALWPEVAELFSQSRAALAAYRD